MNRVLDTADAAFWWLRHHLAIAAVLVAAVVLGLVGLARATRDGEAPQIPAGAVAVVGDAPITESAVRRWQAIFQKATSTAQTKPSAQQVRRAAFELLASSTYVTEEAERLDVTVSEDEVGRSVDAFLEQAGATTEAARAQYLEQAGIRDAELRYQQRVALLTSKLQKRVADAVPQPSAEAVAKAYRDEPQRWARPSRRDVQAVITQDEATARSAKASLAKGDTFAAVTKRSSIDASLTETKGLIKGIEPGQNAASLERPVFAARQGVLSGPVEVQGGWMVFRVQAVTPMPEKDLEGATPAIRKELRGIAQSRATERFVTELRDRWKGETRCSDRVASPEFCA